MVSKASYANYGPEISRDVFNGERANALSSSKSVGLKREASPTDRAPEPATKKIKVEHVVDVKKEHAEGDIVEKERSPEDAAGSPRVSAEQRGNPNKSRSSNEVRYVERLCHFKMLRCPAVLKRQSWATLLTIVLRSDGHVL